MIDRDQALSKSLKDASRGLSDAAKLLEPPSEKTLERLSEDARRRMADASKAPRLSAILTFVASIKDNDAEAMPALMRSVIPGLVREIIALQERLEALEAKVGDGSKP